MADPLIKDYSYLQKDLDSLKLEIWGELVSCCVLRKKLLKLDKQGGFESIKFLDDWFLEISINYSLNLEKTKDFGIMLYLNKTSKAQRLVRRIKKTLKELRRLRLQLERLSDYLNLDE